MLDMLFPCAWYWGYWNCAGGLVPWPTFWAQCLMYGVCW